MIRHRKGPRYRIGRHAAEANPHRPVVRTGEGRRVVPCRPDVCIFSLRYGEPDGVVTGRPILDGGPPDDRMTDAKPWHRVYFSRYWMDKTTSPATVRQIRHGSRADAAGGRLSAALPATTGGTLALPSGRCKPFPAPHFLSLNQRPQRLGASARQSGHSVCQCSGRR